MGFFGSKTFDTELIKKGYIASVPLYDSSLIFLVSGEDYSLGFNFLKVFDVTLWFIISFTTIFIANLIWIIEKSSKGEIKNEYVRGVSRALWNMIIGFFYTNDARIKTFAGRIIYAVFIFMVLVVKIIYLADFVGDYNRRNLIGIYRIF
jgi:hypothetical protein